MLLTGCLAQWENPYFVVTPSGLNWLIVSQQYTSGRLAGHHVKLQINGDGIVTITEGTSQLVRNSFAHNAQSDKWEDIREHRQKITEEEAASIYQSLVSNGLFDQSLFKGKLATNETSSIYVSARIQNTSTGTPRLVTDPELLESLKMTIMTFYTPRPARLR